MTKRVCSQPSCPNLTDKAGRCPEHQRDADLARGTASERGYTSAGHRLFRAAVLAKHPTCVICRHEPATVADHYPISRRDLMARGLNPNDPTRGRGLCASCHGTETQAHQPGGWNAL